jgi:Na+-transporting NADH:ubiquinone oxidoreductase subunit C
MNKDSIRNTFFISISLCLVCSALVSMAAVGLKPFQERNKALDRKKNVLMVAGLYDAAETDVEQVFASRIVDRVIDLATGDDVTAEYPDGAGSYDAEASLEVEGQHAKLDPKSDKAVLKKRENRAHIYIVKASPDDATPAMYVFPIRGKGLWSTLRGFFALDVDLKTVKGITYYEHGETPGLGGEVDNPDWKAKWSGKTALDDSGNVAIKVSKTATGNSVVDALSGATITSNGVQYMIEYWLGPEGFGSFLKKVRGSAESAASTLPALGDDHG